MEIATRLISTSIKINNDYENDHENDKVFDNLFKVLFDDKLFNCENNAYELFVINLYFSEFSISEKHIKACNFITKYKVCAYDANKIINLFPPYYI